MLYIICILHKSIQWHGLTWRRGQSLWQLAGLERQTDTEREREDHHHWPAHHLGWHWDKATTSRELQTSLGLWTTARYLTAFMIQWGINISWKSQGDGSQYTVGEMRVSCALDGRLLFLELMPSFSMFFYIDFL